MRIVDIHAAEANLSRLVEEAARGDAFIIVKDGKPIAQVVPLATDPPLQRKRFGFATTPMSIPDDFNRMGESDVEALFGGS